jgi:murein DD-endopeptidase MepM/ murein hydrolase activator NlpD
MKSTSYLLFIILTILAFFKITPVYAFHSEVFPEAISPGDAFIMKVTDAKSSRPPVAYLKGNRFYFSKSGEDCFIAIGAVGVQTQPGNYTIAIKLGKKKEYVKLTVKSTRFPKKSITVDESQVSLSPEDLKRAKKEEARLKSVFQIMDERLWEGSFIIPIKNEISTVFGTKRIFNGKRVSIHKGIDIRGEDGERVKASNNGKVVLTENMFFGGNTVIIDHGQGIYSIYMHLSGFNVKTGDLVSRGDIIGFVGSSGRATGPHLHFGIKVAGISVNPLSIVELRL